MSLVSVEKANWPPPLPPTWERMSFERPSDDQLSDPVVVRRATRGAPDVPVAVALILLPIRLFLAAGWFRAGVEKFIDGSWWNGDKLRGFLEAHHAQSIGWFRPVMDHAIQPAAIIVALVVMIAELACGIAIITGRHVRLALWCGVVLNVSFILAGQVNPSAFYLVMEMTVLLAMAQLATHARRDVRQGRTLLLSALALLAAVAFVPSIRTLEPAKVIDDSAIMLTFVSVLASAALFVKWLSRRETTTASARVAPLLEGAMRWAGVTTQTDDDGEPHPIDASREPTHIWATGAHTGETSVRLRRIDKSELRFE